MNSELFPAIPPEVDALHAQQVVLLAVATLAELRESDTESHLLRMQHYVRALAQKLRSHPAYEAVLTPGYIDMLCS